MFRSPGIVLVRISVTEGRGEIVERRIPLFGPENGNGGGTDGFVGVAKGGFFRFNLGNSLRDVTSRV